MAKREINAEVVKQDMNQLASSLRALKAKELAKPRQVNQVSVAGIDSILATLKHIGAIVAWE